MGLMDKVKNLFTEEVEVEEEVKEEPIKKETIHVEIPAPVKKEKEEIREEVKQEIPIEEKKEEFNFPFFDDDDFNETTPLPIVKEEKQVVRKREVERKVERKERPLREVYSPPKEEKKVFKPTPIISPVYGILDKNYQKDDIRTKPSKPRSYYNPKEATVDEIRNKAYGTLEDDIETTLFGKNKLLFDDVLDADNDIEKMSSKKNNDDYKENVIGEKPRHGVDEEPEITDLLEAELGKDDIDIEEKPHKISDSELFSMIDSMYQNGGKNDD